MCVWRPGGYNVIHDVYGILRTRAKKGWLDYLPAYPTLRAYLPEGVTVGARRTKSQKGPRGGLGTWDHWDDGMVAMWRGSRRERSEIPTLLFQRYPYSNNSKGKGLKGVRREKRKRG